MLLYSELNIIKHRFILTNNFVLLSFRPHISMLHPFFLRLGNFKVLERELAS